MKTILTIIALLSIIFAQAQIKTTSTQLGSGQLVSPQVSVKTADANLADTLKHADISEQVTSTVTNTYTMAQLNQQINGLQGTINALQAKIDALNENKTLIQNALK